MAVETSAVQISVNVTDNTSSQVLAGVEQNLTKLGAAGTRSGKQVEEGMKGAGKEILSATERTRLASEEMGVRLPRAMVSLISQCKGAQAALSAVSGAMIGFATIQIGAMVFEAAIRGAEKLWDALTSLPKSVQDYQAQVAKTKEDDFGNTHSIETTRQRIDEATEAVKRYRDEANGPQTGMGWRTSLDLLLPGVGDAWQHSHDRGEQNDQAIEGQKKLDKLNHVNEGQQYHEQRLGNIALDHAGDAALKDPQAKHDAQIKEARDRAAEERRYDKEQEGMLGNSVPRDAGAGKEAQTIAAAKIKADAELADAQKHHSDEAKAQAQELAHIHEQALQSGLRGSALYHEQESAAVEDLKSKHIATAQAVEDVHATFHNKEMDRLREQEREVAKMHEQTQLAGLTGTARIKQEGQNRINDVYASTNLNPGQRLAEINEINKQTAQQIGELNKNFTDRVNDIVGRSASRELQGFARIRADAENQIRDLQKDASKNGGTAADLARGEAGINAGAAGQAADLTRKNADETAKIEEEARVKFLSAEKQKTAAISAELEERQQKYLDELNSQEISQDDYNRRVAAAQQNANAEMIEASTEARKKMAGEFTSFFEGMDHPGKYFAKLGDKAAGEAAASLFQRFQGDKGADGAQRGSFGDMFKGFGFGHSAKKTPGAGGASIYAEAGKMFSINSATIQIGNATIGSGNAGVGTGGGANAIGPAGSTTLLAPGMTGATGGIGAGGPSTSAGAAAFSSSGSTVGGAVASGLSAPGGGVGPSRTSQVGGALGNAAQDYGVFKQLQKDFSGGKKKGSGSGDLAETSNYQIDGQFDKDGNFVQGKKPGNGSMTSSGISQANAEGAVQGGMGVWAAHEGGGGWGGAGKGAASGAEMGMMIGGPLGAAIGAVAGAVIGAIGSSHAARDYDLKTVRPRIANDLQAYHSGGMNYMDAYSDGQSLEMEAQTTTKKMGSADSRYYNNTILPEIKEFMGKLTSEQKAGRSQYTASGASYATGTPYVPQTGLNMNHAGERIFSSVDNSQITKAITEGNRGTMPVQPASMGDVHLHVHAIDAKGVSQFLDKYKHNIRSAVNDSYAENSGGGMN